MSGLLSQSVLERLQFWGWSRFPFYFRLSIGVTYRSASDLEVFPSYGLTAVDVLRQIMAISGSARHAEGIWSALAERLQCARHAGSALGHRDTRWWCGNRNVGFLTFAL